MNKYQYPNLSTQTNIFESISELLSGVLCISPCFFPLLYLDRRNSHSTYLHSPIQLSIVRRSIFKNNMKKYMSYSVSYLLSSLHSQIALNYSDIYKSSILFCRLKYHNEYSNSLKPHSDTLSSGSIPVLGCLQKKSKSEF